MMNIQELMNILDIPSAVQHEVLKYTVIESDEVQECIRMLTSVDTWKHALQVCKSQITDDPHGYLMLSYMLKACTYTYENYQKQQIAHSVFVDTMKCFTRFIHEHHVSYGIYGFDRDFWVPRQLSCQLFRLGTLEYELCPDCISIHIPSDACLTKEACISSVQYAKAFFHTLDSSLDIYPYRCTSWLLSPALSNLLHQDSNILQFQQLFHLISWNKESNEYMIWVYHTRNTPLEKLSEHTSLQRTMKQYLLNGGIVGEATGEMK